MLGGALLGVISGLLKSYCNVNEVISGIMLNWITLYVVNILLTNVKEAASPYTMPVAHVNGGAIIPSLGLGKLFNNNQYVTLAIPLAILIAVGLHILLEKTRLGYELKATGNNKNAAKYCGMAERRNLILTLAIGGALAGLGAAMLYLTGYEQWQCSQSSVPAMGFNGIAAAFLGGLNPIGTILASFFIQHITIGGAYVDKTMYCAQVSDLISAIIIYLCALRAVHEVRHEPRHRPPRGEGSGQGGCRARRRKEARSNAASGAIYADLRLRADSRRPRRLLLGALRRHQPRLGGHHGHRRAGRRAGDALPLADSVLRRSAR